MMRTLLCILLLLGLCMMGNAQHIVVRPESSNDTLSFHAQNDLPCPITLSASSKPLDTTFTAYIPDGQERMLFRWPNPQDTLMTKLEQTLNYNYILGDPDAVHDDRYEYNLPFPEGKSHVLTQGNKTDHTHNTKIANYAFDFAMPKGSYVAAARGGIVGFVEENNEIGGEDITLMNKSNRIMVCHDDGTIAAYAHLKKNGAIVEVGDRVFAGQVIGLSGNTGFTTSPHLHFTVLIADRSIPIRFRNEYTILYEGQTYPTDDNTTSN